MIVKAVLDIRRANKEGLFPVKIRISDKGKVYLESLGIYASPDDFNMELGLFNVSKKSPRRDEFAQNNNLISTFINRASDIVYDHKKENKPLNPLRLRKLITEKENETINYNFNTYFKKFAEEKEGRTKDVYITTLNKIEKYFGKSIEFEDVNYTWLTSFNYRMKNEQVLDGKGKVKKIGIETNSRAIHFRNIRAVFNDAINNNIVGLELYPFRKFKIENERTRKRALSREQLKRLFSHSGTGVENFASDMAKLIFFLIGINIKDLHTLNEYDGGYIHYKRAKTGGLYSIKIEPETKKLLDKYKGSQGLLIFQESYKLHTSFMKKINKGLADIAAHIGVPEITTYTLRHSWATIAAEIEIPKETIAAALGHSWGKTVTDVYVDFNLKKIDEANRKVIDYVLKRDEADI